MEDKMQEMTDERAADLLAEHNDWWVRFSGPQRHNREVGRAIDHAVIRLKPHADQPDPIHDIKQALEGREGWHDLSAKVKRTGDTLLIRGLCVTPPAEAQPAAHYCEHRHKCKWHADGSWPSFGSGEGRAQAWKDAHAESCGGRILPLYTAPPSAPVGVEE